MAVAIIVITWMSRRAISATSAPLSKSVQNLITTQKQDFKTICNPNQPGDFFHLKLKAKCGETRKKAVKVVQFSQLVFCPKPSPTLSTASGRPQKRLFPACHFCALHSFWSFPSTTFCCPFGAFRGPFRIFWGLPILFLDLCWCIHVC